MDYDFRTLDLSPQGLEQTSGLLRSAFPGSPHSPALLDWQYNRNPSGKALGYNAFAGDLMVTHCVVLPIEARLFGKPARGVMSLNAGTHPDHHRKGLYFRAARLTYDLAREQGYDFGISVTNANSTRGFIRHVGFHLVRPLDARLGIGPVGRRSESAEVDIERNWTPETLAWRLAHPLNGYRYEQRGERTVVLGPAGKAGIQVILGELGPGQVPTGLDNASLGINPLRLWVGIDPDLSPAWPPYIDLPLALRPSPLNLIFCDLTGKGRTLDPARVRWTGLDFDDF